MNQDSGPRFVYAIIFSTLQPDVNLSYECHVNRLCGLFKKQPPPPDSLDSSLFKVARMFLNQSKQGMHLARAGASRIFFYVLFNSLCCKTGRVSFSFLCHPEIPEQSQGM